VLFQFPNFTDILKTVGIKVEEIKSSPLKAAPNGFEPTSPEARAAIEAIVVDSYAWFKDLVKDRRHMDDAQLAAVDDGRVFTGRRGGSKAGGRDRQRKDRAGLAGEGKEVPATTPVRDYSLEPRFSELSFLHVAALALQTVGLTAFAHRIEEWGGVQALSDLILTVSWRFGTLHRPTDGLASKAASMIKSELVQKIAAQNPHLYQRDVENIVNAILGEVTNAMAQGDRVELRGFGAFSVKHRRRAPAATHAPAPCLGRPEISPVLQDRQGNARAAEQAGCGLIRSLKLPLTWPVIPAQAGISSCYTSEN